jgi:acyl transferase domain-containing protein
MPDDRDFWIVGQPASRAAPDQRRVAVAEANSSPLDPQTDVAIVGMAGRFPGAANVEAFWENLVAGRSGIRQLSDAELIQAGVDRQTLDNPRYVKAGGPLDVVEDFDAAFFGFTPRIAAATDPQHRILLECARDALETAGYYGPGYSGRIGLFAGSFMSKYAFHLYDNPEVLASIGRLQARLSVDKDFLTTLISYKLALRGPSIAVQTACSTSLVAVHLACQSLLGGECEMALAGGVTVHLPHRTGYMFVEGGIESPDGRCRAFDSQAAGTVGASGAGIVVLKLLQDALADRDQIHAVIRGTAINNDGALKAGYSAPSIEGQAAVIREAIAVSGVDPRTIGYVEAHGTATPLGDAVEVAALRRAFAASDRSHKCAIGSVKSNIGHLDAAAGVAGLIKVSLALERKCIPPSLHYNESSEELGLDAQPFFVNASPIAWEPIGSRRRAGLSSFGMGGTNAHAVLEEAPGLPQTRSSRAAELLVLSAKTEQALAAAASNLGSFLARHDDLVLADVAHTLQVGREPFAYRAAIVATSVAEAVARLSRMPASADIRPADKDGAVGLEFVDANALNDHSGNRLYAGEAGFRLIVDSHVATATEFLGFNPGLSFSVAGAGVEFDPRTRLARAIVLQVSLAQWLTSMGIAVGSVVANGTGEYAAVAFAGMMSIREVLGRLRASANSVAKDSRRGIGPQPVGPAGQRMPLFSRRLGRSLVDSDLVSADFWNGELKSDDGRDKAFEAALGVTTIVDLGSLLVGDRSNVGSGEAGKSDEVVSVLGGLGKLWTIGQELDWAVLRGSEPARRVALPTYAYQRQRYWIEAPSTARASGVALPDPPEPPEPRANGGRPGSIEPLQFQILQIWRAVLGFETLSIDDDFFEIGGDSLAAMELMAKLNDDLGVDLPISVLFDYPTINDLASHLLNDDLPYAEIIRQRPEIFADNPI